MLSIKNLELEGFRGFTQKASFAFESPVILMFGGNHQGKSSVLNAVEWCLYGDVCIGEKSGIRERVGTGEMAWRVVNDHCEKVKIKLELEDPHGRFIVIREEEKGKGKGGKKIKIYLPDKTEKEGNEAEQELARLLRLSFKDFTTSIYQHQETIHDFIIKKPSEQSDAIDRLLGLSDYRNIVDGIRKSDISKAQKELAEGFSMFQVRIQEAITQRQKDMDDKKVEAKERALAEDELNKNKLFEMAGSTKKEVASFAQLLGVKTKAISTPSDWKGIKLFNENIKGECDRLWAESPEIKEQQEKHEKRTRLLSLKSSYETQLQDLKEKENELQCLERKNGNKSEIEDKIKKITREIEAIDKEIKLIAPKTKLIEEGISILKTASPSEVNICPLCGAKKPNLLGHLQKEWKEKIKAKVEELNKRQTEFDQKKTDYEKIREEHIRLVEEVQREKERLDRSIDSISKFLKKELTNKDDPVAIISREIENINLQLKKIENAIKSKREKIASILEKTDTMSLLYDILLLKNKIKEIEKIKNTDEFKKQEEIKDKASKLVSDIGKINEIIKSCMKKEAEEKISSAKEAIDVFFRKITDNPAFQKLNIKIEVDPRTGGNFYIFEDQDGKRPIPILSQGDLNSLALSIFLGLAKTSEDSHPLGFILMDDPSQSLDFQQKVRFIESLNELSKIKDIIISTMDTELHKLLKSRITKVKTTYKFSDWEPKAGPGISMEK